MVVVFHLHSGLRFFHLVGYERPNPMRHPVIGKPHLNGVRANVDDYAFITLLQELLDVLGSCLEVLDGVLHGLLLGHVDVFELIL